MAEYNPGPWRMAVWCPENHRFGVDLSCPDCEREKARAAPPPTTVRPGRFATWRALRKLRRQLRNF